MAEKERPGLHQLDGFRGQEPKPGETDEQLSPPVNDDDSPQPRASSVEDPPVDPPKEDDEPEAPRKAPSDEARDKIAKRYSAKQAEEPEPVKDEEAKPEPEKAEGEKEPEAPADEMELKVNGKTMKRSIEQIAVDSELTVDEVRADPERAKKYAQIHLSGIDRLERAKKVTREAADTASRLADDGGTRPPAAPNQDGDKNGKKDDGTGQPSDTAQPGDVDYSKLTEAIQLEDPKEAGKLLKDAIESAAKRASTEVVSESKAVELRDSDIRASQKGVAEFAAAHSEIAGNEYIAGAMKPAMLAECRSDLIKAMQAEGKDDAEEIIAQANEAQIFGAHQARRIGGDPNVRKLDKAFVEAAYSRVTKALGTPKAEPKQDFVQTRETRKENLQPQPRRASTPPAQRQAPEKEITRKDVVSQMAGMRGQKRPTAS